MVMEEIYILSKHGRMPPDYVEKIPVYKRRFYLEMLKDELEEQKKAQEKAESKARAQSSRIGRR